MSFSWRHPAAWSDQPVLRRCAIGACALVLIGASAVAAFHVSEQRGIAEARWEADHKLDLFASAVHGVVRRLEPVPATIQLNHQVLALLREPDSAARIAAVSDYLRRLNAHVGSLAAYVLNDRGVVLASSNPQPGDDSAIGEDLSFRPYFLEALSGRVGRHFAIGIKGAVPGYFVSHPIHDGPRVVGVAAIKVSLEPIDQTWAMLGAPALLADTNQVVILASDPAWRYTTLAELPPERRVDLQLTRLYNDLRMPRFPAAGGLPPEESFSIVPRPAALGAHAAPTAGVPQAGTMVMARPLDGMDWRLMLFTDLLPVRNRALMAGAMAAVAAGFVVLLLLHLAQRRRILRQRLEAEHLLASVNAELERKVAARTQDLTAANARLRTEVAEREQAECGLRAAQSELVHAAKMAVLGQLATSITHELTQPLGAIRTLSGNALEFQKRGEEGALSGNLKIIARLADQMGGIIQPLKSFARKSQPTVARADVATAVAQALFLFDLPLRKQGVVVDNRCEPGRHHAWCDANRLEQVLINLVGNAIDAMRDAPRRELTLQAAPCEDGRCLCIEVLDTGGGLPDDVRGRLFEPFFTTKASGAGLGLGLVISRDIVRGFGGEIEAAARAEGGACFRIRLPAAPAGAAGNDEGPVAVTAAA